MAMSVTSPSGREGSPSSLAASVSGGMKDLGPLVGAIDQGTGSTRFLVFAANTAELVTYHQIEVESINPKQGWVEQDPLQLLRTVEQCISATVINLSRLDVDLADCVAVGIANQRETTIVWDKLTGEPLYNAILWLDTRTQGTVEAILARLPRDANSANYLQHLCGLPISTYFSALKIRWLLDNVKEVALALKEDRLLFGTVDTWLLWKLTGGAVHATDVTNASRTMLMNIETLKWDPYLLKFFGIPESILPEIRSSSEIYGKLASTELKGTPISGVLGDQQAALVGQGCFRPGQAKNTYGTGCFLLYNVGPRVVFSERGLLSTVAYKLGPNRPAAYALEGSVAVAGAASLWLKDRLGCIDKVTDVEALASSVPDSADCYFVPAFSGLYAPYWRPDARGILCGMTQFTSREHVCRAALESIAFQTREILEAMECDSSLGLSSSSLLVDGGMSQNGLLMQIQSDLIGVPVLRPAMAETTALGAAIAAGCADGIDAWDLRSVAGEVTTDKFLPRLTEEERDVRLDRWKLAVSKSFGWATAASPSGGGSEGGAGRPRAAVAVVSDSTRRLFASVPPAMFMFSSLMLWKLADAVAEGTSNS